MARTRADEKVRELSQVGLFSRCSKRELQAVAGLCMPLPIEAGFVLTTEGAPGRECFVIADGKAQVTIGGRLVGMAGPGDCVGEIALLDGGRRTATVTAETPMTVFVLSTAEFQALLEMSPTVVGKIAVSLARRLRTAEANQPH